MAAWWERSQRAAQVRRVAEAKGRVEGQPLTMAQALAVPFKAKRPARTQKCARCGATARQWHHALGAQHLRTYMRGEAQRRRLEPDTVMREMRRLLADERNTVPYCGVCHSAGDPLLGGGFTAADVPASAHAFAASLGPEWSERLRRAYGPPGEA